MNYIIAQICNVWNSVELWYVCKCLMDSLNKHFLPLLAIVWAPLVNDTIFDIECGTQATPDGVKNHQAICYLWKTYQSPL